MTDELAQRMIAATVRKLFPVISMLLIAVAILAYALSFYLVVSGLRRCENGPRSSAVHASVGISDGSDFGHQVVGTAVVERPGRLSAEWAWRESSIPDGNQFALQTRNLSAQNGNLSNQQFDKSPLVISKSDASKGVLGGLDDVHFILPAASPR